MALTLGPSLLRQPHASRTLLRANTRRRTNQPAPETRTASRVVVQVSEVHLHGVSARIDAAALRLELGRTLKKAVINGLPVHIQSLQSNASSSDIAQHITAEIVARTHREQRHRFAEEQPR